MIFTLSIYAVAFIAIYLFIPFNADYNNMAFAAGDQANLGQELLRVLELTNENKGERIGSYRVPLIPPFFRSDPSLWFKQVEAYLLDASELQTNPQWLIA